MRVGQLYEIAGKNIWIGEGCRRDGCRDVDYSNWLQVFLLLSFILFAAAEAAVAAAAASRMGNGNNIRI